jgi:hypothetical protein
MCILKSKIFPQVVQRHLPLPILNCTINTTYDCPNWNFSKEVLMYHTAIFVARTMLNIMTSEITKAPKCVQKKIQSQTQLHIEDVKRASSLLVIESGNFNQLMRRHQSIKTQNIFKAQSQKYRKIFEKDSTKSKFNTRVL